MKGITMTHYLSNVALVLALAATAWSCNKEPEQPGTETAADAQLPPENSAGMMQPGSENTMQPDTGHMMQPGSGNTMQPGTGHMMEPGSGHMMQPGSGNTMQPGSGTMTEQMRTSCPMVVEATKVQVSDTDDGVALTFTTESGDVADLRQRVQHMAGMYEMHRGQGHMMWQHMGQGQGMGQGMGRQNGMGMGSGRGAAHGVMPAATTKVENIGKGARVVLKPVDAAQLTALREHARWHAERLQSRECWLLQEAKTAKQPGR